MGTHQVQGQSKLQEILSSPPKKKKKSYLEKFQIHFNHRLKEKSLNVLEGKKMKLQETENVGMLPKTLLVSN